ncbi:hypothetical protein RAA17_11120 [Komagataeibacter rhaeticus]|nr:hypothetical protein [Komagataeibacter rhaeticus]
MHRVPDGGWIVTDATGVSLPADIVVIATSHPAPQPPGVLRALDLHPGQHPILVTNPWQAGALDDIRHTDSVLVVGSGLSMADAIVSLTARGHTGRVTAISRRGQRSHGHATGAVKPVGISSRRLHARPAICCNAYAMNWPGTQASHGRPYLTASARRPRYLGSPFGAGTQAADPPPATVLGYAPLPHRPQADEVLRARERAGTLDVRAARVVAARVRHGQFALTLRHGSSPAWEACYDAIITTTGPAHGAIMHMQPYIGGLRPQGWWKWMPRGLACMWMRWAVPA